MSTESNTPARLDEACRILTVASSLAAAHSFINRLKALSPGSQNDTPTPESEAATIIPWTISNRYYTADVHFSLRVIHALSAAEFDHPQPPPAVIYVWVQGEPYAKHVEELSRLIGEYEPEVALAVQIPRSGSTDGLTEVGEDSADTMQNDSDVDATLMSYRFEYVDATGEMVTRRPRNNNDNAEDGANVDVKEEDEDDLRSGDDIPHLPRVLDALSTIMWPSMKSAKKTNAKPTGLDAKSKREHDAILEELLSHDSGVSPSSLNVNVDAKDAYAEGEGDLLAQMQEIVKASGQQKRSAAACFAANNPPSSMDSPLSPFDFDAASKRLPLQLQTNAASKQRPWLSAQSSWNTFSSSSSTTSLGLGGDGDIIASPTDTEMDTRTPFGTRGPSAAGEERGGKFSLGFEDDFTVFVSAPAVATPDPSNATPSALETPGLNNVPSTSGLGPASARVGYPYRSLGSVSDFGGSDDGREEAPYSNLDDDVYSSGDDGDDDLPTEEEVRETSAKIFGSAGRGDVAGGSVPKVKRDVPAALAIPSDAVEDQDEEEDGQGEGGDGEDVAPFDLEKVLNALQQFKTDIAGMDGEEERRRAAARVALGLVYGLEGGVRN
ncbi:hypothetical protein B0H34DRAFT_674567 [Crassisporium funariophilum]|nr:hypothetical protein B0H34DRAFT_674567 [Crassisporium funariophilum]